MKGRSKKARRVRPRDWGPHDVDALTHERRRHRGRDSGVSPKPTAPRDYFTDIEPNALVVSPYGTLAFVSTADREALCRVHERLVEGKTSILAPGDQVLIEYDEDEPVVKAVAPRRTKLSRPAVGLDREQVIAANVDLLVIVASAKQPPFKPGLVDRYLVMAEVGGVRPILCVNKMDLVEAEPPEVQGYREIGLTIANTSCLTGVGLDGLRKELEGSLSVLGGHSGVGKSSLINALCPGLELFTREVSDTAKKGRHATTSSRLHKLDARTGIIDTPGMKQLGVWGVATEELDFYFPEMAEVAPLCRFRDCTHLHEPDCAVRAAVQAGQLSRRRYDSYRRIRESL